VGLRLDVAAGERHLLEHGILGIALSSTVGLRHYRVVLVLVGLQGLRIALSSTEGLRQGRVTASSATKVF
jgi:hypothetical protein